MDNRITVEEMKRKEASLPIWHHPDQIIRIDMKAR